MLKMLSHQRPLQSIWEPQKEPDRSIEDGRAQEKKRALGVFWKNNCLLLFPGSWIAYWFHRWKTSTVVLLAQTQGITLHCQGCCTIYKLLGSNK